MLDFRKGYAGVFVLLRIRGTAWPYGILPGLISASIGLALGLQAEANDAIATDDEFMVNHYPFQLFAFLVGFFMVFRTNFTYKRYWLALEAVQVMGARWLACACLAVATDSPGNADASLPYLMQSARRQTHNGDDGLQVEVGDDKVTGGPEHAAFFAEVVHLFSLLHALALQHLRMEPTLDHLQDSAWEGGEWLRLFESGAAGNMSPAERCLKDSGRSALFEDVQGKLRLKVLGKLSLQEQRMLEMDSAGRELEGDVRVSMVISWLMRRLVSRHKHEPAGDMLRTSPPILSRLFALISDGALAFSQAKKIAEVPFPFPYHNLKETFLWIYVATVPIVVNAKLNHMAARFVVNFMVVWAYFALSKVGDDLEDPYYPHDPNDLPLTHIHQSFNVQLLSYGMVPPSASEAPASVLGDDTPEGGLEALNGSAEAQLPEKKPLDQALAGVVPPLPVLDGPPAQPPVCTEEQPRPLVPSAEVDARSPPQLSGANAFGCWWFGIPCQ